MRRISIAISLLIVLLYLTQAQGSFDGYATKNSQIKPTTDLPRINAIDQGKEKSALTPDDPKKGKISVDSRFLVTGVKICPEGTALTTKSKCK